MRTAEEIRTEISNLEKELHAISGEPLYLWTGRDGDIADTPEGGALMHVQWAIEDASFTAWYPDTEKAKAALLALARQNGRVPSNDGFHVDLTSPGCHTSRAWIER